MRMYWLALVFLFSSMALGLESMGLRDFKFSNSQSFFSFFDLSLPTFEDKEVTILDVDGFASLALFVRLVGENNFADNPDFNNFINKSLHRIKDSPTKSILSGKVNELLADQSENKISRLKKFVFENKQDFSYLTYCGVIQEGKHIGKKRFQKSTIDEIQLIEKDQSSSLPKIEMMLKDASTNFQNISGNDLSKSVTIKNIDDKKLKAFAKKIAQPHALSEDLIFNALRAIETAFPAFEKVHRRIKLHDAFFDVALLTKSTLDSLVSNPGHLRDFFESFDSYYSKTEKVVDNSSLYFIHSLGWGDCACGCISRRYWIFNVKQSSSSDNEFAANITMEKKLGDEPDFCSIMNFFPSNEAMLKNILHDL